jgi:hypothetical protein
VYPNTPFGFGTPVVFALPTGFPTDAFATTENDTLACPRPVYGFFDVDGDRKPDLVFTTACDDASVGTSTWRVYKNIGSGVAAPATITLPTKAGFTLGAFASPRGGALGCETAQSIPHWSLLDFDGDLAPDILVTQTCNDVTVGTSAWLLFHGGANGFDASPARVPLPVIAGAPLQSAFLEVAANANCKGTIGEPGYALVDVNADFKPDLLVTRACGDTTTGVSRWLVYPNAGSAFATSARTYSLPVALGGTVTEPIGLAAALSCTGTPRPAFATGFLAHLRFDAVATSVCHDSTVGTTRWQVFESSCP